VLLASQEINQLFIAFGEFLVSGTKTDAGRIDSRKVCAELIDEFYLEGSVGESEGQGGSGGSGRGGFGFGPSHHDEDLRFLFWVSQVYRGNKLAHL
jgi:hypothetical protein